MDRLILDSNVCKGGGCEQANICPNIFQLFIDIDCDKHFNNTYCYKLLNLSLFLSESVQSNNLTVNSTHPGVMYM